MKYYIPVGNDTIMKVAATGIKLEYIILNEVIQKKDKYRMTLHM